MPTAIGKIEAIFRYPVKSMRGELLTEGALGWHGLDGDRRLALRRLDHGGGFPWLSASRVPELVLFKPQWRGDADGDALPTHVLTPDGEEMPVFGEALAAEVGRRHGGAVVTFGDQERPPAVAVTMRDLRCTIVNVDPDDAGCAPEVLKAVTRANQSNAGVYATATHAGRLAVGQTVMLHR